ncbi:MAG: hypothetical protein ISR50_11760 [Alphaproteobacteria bacterium]|nr:hypothetical protein [Alphaproteobacteria bacterium]MBL6953304.1 hypothetical protein [Alphaproteobacteria bacterium]
MPYDASNLMCVAGNSRASHWAYSTTDRPAEVLAPGYFPDDRMRNFMHPGEILTLTCLSLKTPSRHRHNPIAVLQAVTARTREGVWLVLPLTPIARPGQAAARCNIPAPSRLTGEPG